MSPELGCSGWMIYTGMKSDCTNVFDWMQPDVNNIRVIVTEADNFIDN